MTAAANIVPAAPASRDARRSRRDTPARRGRPHLVPVPDTEPPLETASAGAGSGPTRSPAGRRAPDPAGPGGAPKGLATQGYATPATPGRAGTGGAGRSAGAEPRRGLPSTRPDVGTHRPLARLHPRGGWLPAGPDMPQAAAPVAARQRVGRRVTRGLARPTVISRDAVPGWSRENDVGVRMTMTADLPPASATGAALARALLEVLTGDRPIEQLRAHCAPEVFAGLEDAPMLGRRGTVRLLSTWVCEPADGAVELSAVFRCAERVRAMAMRLQGVDGRWRITALHLG